MLSLEKSSLAIFAGLLLAVGAYPLERSDDYLKVNENAREWDGLSLLTVGLTIAFLICVVVAISACTCCQDSLFATKDDSSVERRHSMEPPSYSSPSTPRISESDVAVTIEPLPNTPGKRSSLSSRYAKPMCYNQVINRGPDVGDWFKPDGRTPDFPRAQLQYVKELGTGWFGTIVEGEASKMGPGPKKIKVIVQILKDDLTSLERAFILHNARMFRDVAHDNVLKIIGKCVDKQPYLLLFEHFQADFLKNFLIAKRGVADDLISSGQILKICHDICNGLWALHQAGFVHNDLACRNCLINSKGIVKIGDYGLAPSVFRDEYLLVGDIAVPIRWVSPESVDVAESGQVITKEISQAANIWTLGVVMWEVFEFGKTPYMDLSDEGVINAVLKTRNTKLGPPQSPMSHRERLYEIMRLCWLTPDQRPSASEIAALLSYMYQHRPPIDPMEDFDLKWNSFLASRQPVKSVESPSNNNKMNSPIPTDPGIVHDEINIAVTATPEEKREADHHQTAMISPSNVVPEELAVSKDYEPVLSATVADISRERIEKRNFILTLNTEDLAAMSSSDLVDFYEYLSPEEIQDLERRHHRACEEAQQNREREQKRQAFSAMSLEEMSSLSTDVLSDYLLCLDENSRKETEKKLQNAANAKRDEAKRLLSLTDQQLVSLSAAELQAKSVLLSSDEVSVLLDRHQQLQKRRQLIHSLDDKELAEMSDDKFEWYSGILNPDEAEKLRTRRQAFLTEKREKDPLITKIINSDGYELYSMSDSSFFAPLLDDIDPIERHAVETRLNEVKRRRAAWWPDVNHSANISFDEHIHGQDFSAEEIATIKNQIEHQQRATTERRHALLSSDGLELLNLFDTHWEEYERLFDNREREMLVQKTDAVRNARIKLLEADDEQLSAIGQDGLMAESAYLTPVELELLCSRMAQIKLGERRQLHDKVMNADNLALYLLSLEGLDPYLESLDEAEAASVKSRLEDITRKRQSLLSSETVSLNDEAEKYLTEEEAVLIKERRRQKEEEMRQEILSAHDVQLFELYENKWADYFPYLTVGEREGVQTWVDTIKFERERVLRADDQALSEVPDETFQTVAKYFTMDEFKALSDRRQKLIAERNSMIEWLRSSDPLAIYFWCQERGGLDAVRGHLPNEESRQLLGELRRIQEMRETMLNADERKLLTFSHDDLRAYLHVDEQSALAEKQQFAAKRLLQTADDRQLLELAAPLEKILVDNREDTERLHERLMSINARRIRVTNASLDELANMTDAEFEECLKVLDDDDARRIRSQRQGLTTPGKAQSQELVESVLKLAQDQLLENHHQEQNLTRHQELDRRKSRQMSIEPLSLDESDASTLPPSDFAAQSTPELRKDYYQHRQRVLQLDDTCLNGMSQDEFEDYFQYLSPEEIFSLNDRRRRIQSRGSNGAEDGETAGGSVSQASDTESSYTNAWDARDRLLHMDEAKLAAVEEGELQSYMAYFTSDEFRQIEQRWESATQRRQFVLGASDEQLAACTPQMLEDCLLAIDETQRQAVRDRASAVQLQRLPEALNDPAAFRDILKTVPSIMLTSESEFSALDDSSKEKLQKPQLELNFNMSQLKDLVIPEIFLQAATPTAGMSPMTDHAPHSFGMDDIVQFDESSYVNESSSVDDRNDRVSSTPIYESFVDSLLSEIHIPSVGPSDLTNYVTANSDFWHEPDTSRQSKLIETNGEMPDDNLDRTLVHPSTNPTDLMDALISDFKAHNDTKHDREHEQPNILQNSQISSGNEFPLLNETLQPANRDGANAIEQNITVSEDGLTTKSNKTERSLHAGDTETLIEF